MATSSAAALVLAHLVWSGSPLKLVGTVAVPQWTFGCVYGLRSPYPPLP